MRYVALAALASLFLVSSCRSARMQKMLMYHSIQLEQLVERDMAAPDKMDVLAALMVEALEESLEFKKTKDSVKFLKAYTEDNKSSLDALYREFSKWYIALSPTQKLIETTRVASKPYVRQVLIVVPQVETKINRKLKTIFGLTRFIKLFKLL